ncbi:ABC-2 type transporter [uncultured archaeon]|nr:ABC-2 type transporter [uncultured archaeon]
MSELSGLYAIWYRELKVFIRERSRIVSSAVSPLMWLVVFGTGLGASISSVQGVDYQSYIYPGILVMSILFSSVFYGVYVVWDRKIDFLKEVLVAPLSRTTIFLGKALGGTTDAMIESLILIALGSFFGVHFTLLMFLYTMAIIFTLTLGIVSIGLIIGSLLSSPEGFGLISSFVTFPIFFLSGALFPVDNLPRWLFTFVSINPVSYGVDLLRGIILGVPLTFSPMLDVSVIIAFAAVLVALGTVAFKKMKL